MIFVSCMFTIVSILSLDAWHIYYAFMNIFCHSYFIFFGQFRVFTRVKFQATDTAYQMNPPFHVWWLRITFRHFFDPKTVFIKLFYMKTKQKCILVLSIRNEVDQAQIRCIQSIQSPLNTARLQCFISRTHNWHTSNILENQRDKWFSYQFLLYRKVWFGRQELNFSKLSKYLKYSKPVIQ